MKLKAVLTAAMLLAPTAALAAPGIVTTSAGLRAGPGPGFPLVDRIPGGARVNIHGCLRGDAWCDVSWSDDRGWISSQYLEYLYHNSYVYLPDYVDEIDVPIVPFVLSSYWSSYYAGRPWYHRQAYWSNYWTSHRREASRMTIDRSATRIGRAATRNAAISQGRTPRGGFEGRGMRDRNAQFRDQRGLRGREALGREALGREGMRGRERFDGARVGREGITGRERFGNERGAARVNARMQPPAARAREGARFSAAPTARPMQRVAKPTVGGNSPVNARAQAPMSHAAPAMPHGGGGAPHINAAPRGGGGPAGAPGREHH
ncbi:MAG TPA: SH3 domain-containing protein [Bradyrhizobium sp.]|uniref:SH3 domain-containing protein n=1 Tax=Bradyrhizobium sp. TaxID=376 RepID=UPI002D802F2D|nr:SH3 domain-containing protein [Bradyrhizobium sp.]HET7885857.1 SH3 domain-containing protein [Bradyrhizobium sp.]